MGGLRVDRWRCFGAGDRGRGFLIGLWGLGLLASCSYPVRSTPLWPVRSGERSTLERPDHIHSLTVVGAELPPRKRGGLAWDEDGSGPDPFLRIYRDGELLWESPVRHDTRTPRWDHTFPRAVRLPPGAFLRVELWDADFPRADPAGVWRQRGLPTALQGGHAVRLRLEGGAVVTLRIGPPVPMRGTGIARYEVRPDDLLVLRVLPDSPAARAGVRTGDRIVAIDGESVARMGAARAVGRLAQAGRRRGVTLRLRRPSGRVRTVTLDGGFVWPTM